MKSDRFVSSVTPSEMEETPLYQLGNLAHLSVHPGRFARSASFRPNIPQISFPHHYRPACRC